LERRIGGVRAGSAAYVWTVGPVGDRLLRLDLPGRRRRVREPSQLFLDHCLAIADAHLTVLRAHRAGALELVEVQTEPACWRTFTGLGGARLVLQPDLYLVTGDPADPEFVNRWFIEIDRGSENPARLLAKCAHYEAYRRSGSEQAAHRSFPLVVWVMRDEAQASRLRTAIASDGTLDPRLYRVTTADDVVRTVQAGAV
jgi:hypothetical protein